MQWSTTLTRIQRDGLRGTARYALRRTDSLLSVRRCGIADALEQCERHDRTVDLATSTWDLGAFRKIMTRHLRCTPADVFVDYGSGTGKALLMAATLPFRRILGVEFSKDLADASLRILGPVRPRLRCPDIAVVHADAAAFELPDDATVLYFYNPFWGDVLTATLQRIHASLLRRPRPLRIVARNPAKFAAAAAHHPWLAPGPSLHFPECWFPFQLFTTRS